MRREEFLVEDEAMMENVLQHCSYGTLSLIADGKPYGVALNFVWHDGKVCFHGAKEGRKVEAISQHSTASFLAVESLSLIPSYFSDTKSACPATHYFASVHIEGVISMIEDATKKSEILGALMRKLQPDGGYQVITPENPIYTKMLDKTGVFVLDPIAVTMKVKAGQNLSISQKALLIEKLERRGDPLDKVCVAWMEKF